MLSSANRWLATTAPVSEVCGEQPGTVCRAVYEGTDNETLAQVADFLLAKPSKILLVLAIAWLVSRLLRRAIRRFVAGLKGERMQRGISLFQRSTPDLLARTDGFTSLRRQQRAETIGALLISISAFIIWVLAGVTILGTIGVNLGPLIAGAGIAGIALGFGAQNLVRDFLSGIFMLLEDQYGVGDVIDVGEASGVVESVGLRTTELRGVDGTLWHVPNGEIRRVGNLSHGWSRVVLDVDVAYSTDLRAAAKLIGRVAEELWRDPEWAERILEQPEVWGVEDLGPSSVKVRLVVKTRPLEQWNVARELRARLKAALEAAGVEIPLTQPALLLQEQAPDAGKPPPGNRRR